MHNNFEKRSMNQVKEEIPSKVPQITLLFWIVKILATTLGETAGDALSMTMQLGYGISSVIFFIFFLISIVAQISAKSFHRFLYWAVIITTTTVGTTMADYATRSLGIGYAGGASMLFIALLLVLTIWRFSEGTISVVSIKTHKGELFYWLTILFSQTLGTALGDFFSDSSGLGYEKGALVFAAALTVVAVAYFYTKISHTLLFWTAFILTRPLGATLGDLLTKPLSMGGLNLSRITSSIVIFIIMFICVLFTDRRGAQPNHLRKKN